MTVRLYTRHGCHLCEEVADHLARLAVDYPHVLQKVDIDSTPELAHRYGLAVPVVVVDRRYVLAGRIDERSLREALRLAVAG